MTVVNDEPVQGELIATTEPLAPLWRANDVANYLAISPLTVVRNARSGKWPSRRPGRAYLFSPDDVAEIVRLTRTVGR